MKPREKVDRARKASELIENPLYIEAWDKINDVVLREFKETDLLDQDKREAAYLMMRCSDLLKKHFEKIIISGKNAEKELLRLES